MKMAIKTRIINTTKDRLLLCIINSHLRGLCHYTQTGEKQMLLKGILLTFDVWQVVLAMVISLIQAKQLILFRVKPDENGEVQVYGHEEHDHD